MIVIAANEAHFCDCCRDMGDFRSASKVFCVKCFVNVHLHCNDSSRVPQSQPQS